jgi:hypothetical protein
MAMSIVLTNDDALVGTASYPELSFELSPVSFEEFSRSGGPGEIEVQTIRFAGNFGLSDGMTLSAILKNAQSSYVTQEETKALSDSVSISEDLDTNLVEG